MYSAILEWKEVAKEGPIKLDNGFWGISKPISKLQNLWQA